MHKILFSIVLLTPLFLFASTAAAGEIQYAHVEDVHDTDLYIQYKGPGGVQNFVCDVVTTDCEPFGETEPVIFPSIEGKTDYPNSSNGIHGIIEEEGDTGIVYTLYDVAGSVAMNPTVLQYSKETSAYKFSWADNHFMLFATDGTVTTYNIPLGTQTTITPSQTELPLRSISPHAKYLSAYNYVDEAHKIWNTTTGAETVIKSTHPALVEFSQNERYAAFTDTRDGYQTLYIVDMSKSKKSITRVFKDDFVVEDYIWFKDELYVIGNAEDDPYRWVLYRYTPGAKKSRIIAEDVSYGDYMRPIGEYALSFLTIDGKNSHVALYDPEDDEVRVIAPVDESPASDEIERTVVQFKDGAYGVLYEPEHPGRKPDLYVWLHGGPKRQTSVGYHSYLSYAVYDELLERLVESGAYVLKLDYPGSYGYEQEFMDQLEGALGKVDVKSVTVASREIQKKYRIGDTYLIGNSYGGYLGPKVLVDEQKYFDGAVAINGVFDWFTLLERIPSSPFKTYFNGLADLDDLKKNFKLYEQASIVSELPDLKSKDLVLIYGEDDATVPTWQTREFFYLAESLNKDVSLLRLEGEDHIIRQRESLDTMCEFIADEFKIKDLSCT